MTPAIPTTARPPAGRGVLGVLLVLLLAGCAGLRLETEPPPAPVPDARETVRQRAALDARAIADLADSVLATAADPSVGASVTEVATASRAHLDALGGVYEPPVTDDPSPAAPWTATRPTATPPAPDDAPAPDGAPVPEEPAVPAPGPTELVALLGETSASARADAETADGEMARLLASVAVARRLLATALARAAGLPPVDPDAAATAVTVPATVPPGVDEPALVRLVQSEDALGLAWEVVAARSQGDARAATAARAEQHRTLARRWAAAGGVAGTAADPRRVAYDLPPELTGPVEDPAATAAMLGRLEGALSASYATLVALAEPGSRSELVDAMLDAARQEAALLGVTPTFPGAPDLAVPAP